MKKLFYGIGQWGGSDTEDYQEMAKRLTEQAAKIQEDAENNPNTVTINNDGNTGKTEVFIGGEKVQEEESENEEEDESEESKEKPTSESIRKENEENKKIIKSKKPYIK